MSTAISRIAAVIAGAAIVFGSTIVEQVNTSHMGSAMAAAPAPDIRPGEPMLIEDAVAAITIGKTTREEMVKLLGEPRRYMWGQQTFTPPRLPDQYVMVYDALNIMMGGGTVAEIRLERPSPYKFRDKIGFGSPLADVLNVLGQPRKTVEGQSITFQEGVLYRKCRSGGLFDGYYQRSDQGIRLFMANDRVVGIYLMRTVPAAENVELAPSSFTSEKIDQLAWGKSTREDVIKVLGEPAKYVWGAKTFTPDTLPQDIYLMVYPGDDQVMIRNGRVTEVRVHQEGPFRFKGLKVGSPLADVLQTIGQPKSTVDGGPNGFQEGVLYKNIDKQPGRGYYQRSDVGVRMFLLDNAVNALYLIPPKK